VNATPIERVRSFARIAARSTPFLLGRWGAEDIVGHRHGAAVNAFGTEFVLRFGEVEHVTGVVAVAEEDAASLVTGPGNRFDLLRGR
jgi:hypothetical protein